MTFLAFFPIGITFVDALLTVTAVYDGFLKGKTGAEFRLAADPAYRRAFAGTAQTLKTSRGLEAAAAETDRNYLAAELRALAGLRAGEPVTATPPLTDAESLGRATLAYSQWLQQWHGAKRGVPTKAKPLLAAGQMWRRNGSIATGDSLLIRSVQRCEPLARLRKLRQVAAGC